MLVLCALDLAEQNWTEQLLDMLIRSKGHAAVENACNNLQDMRKLINDLPLDL